MAIATTTVADVLAAQLAAAGVRNVYGFPGGGSNLDVIAALGRHGVGFVLSRTEGGAAFMACAAAERTGAPGVVLVGNGPGLASTVNGVAHAHLDRVPLLVISDRYTGAELRTSGHQILDQRAMLAPLIRWSATVDPDDAAATFREAIAHACGSYAGPVHLDMPRDAAAAAVPDAPAVPEDPEPPFDVPPLPVPDALLRARRPVLLLGLEAARPAIATEDVIALADALGAAVLTTYKAKGAYPERGPRWAGIVTAGEIERGVLDASDAIVAVGLDPVELLTRDWPYATPVVNLRACAAEADYVPLDLTTDLGAAIRALTGTLRADRVHAGWDLDAIARARDAALDRLRLRPPEGLAGWEVVEAVQAAAGDDVPVTVDAGAHMFPAVSFWRASAPRSFLISNGLATMGFAVPSAMGLAQAGERPAIAITGDGGMAYNMFELAVAAEHELPVVVVVLNDSSLSLIRIKHEAKGHPRADLDLSPVAFAQVARGLGVEGAFAHDAASLRDAVTAALQRSGPTVIDVPISGAEHADVLAAIRG